MRPNCTYYTLKIAIKIAIWLTIGVMALSSVQAQTIRLVPQEYPTIQEAIDASGSGDTVLVSPGTYYEIIEMPARPLTLKSVTGPASTIINGLRKGTVVSVAAGATRATVLSGFTITQGYNDQGAGGLQLVGHASITGNFIIDNFGRCAGVSLISSAALLYRNVIARNRSIPGGASGGGGIGVAVGGNPCPDFSCGAEIIGNLIEDNHADNCASGGGIRASAAGSIRIVGNIIRRNSIEAYGGGIYVGNDTRALIENNLIADNSAGTIGGGIFWLTPNQGALPNVVNNTIANNQAPSSSAVHVDGTGASGRLQNNLIVDLSGAGSLVGCGYFSSNPTIPLTQNNNFYSAAGEVFGGGCVNMGAADGNISEEPIFLSHTGYRLSPLSSGIDSGQDAFSSLPIDLLGTDRIADGDGDGFARIDMGAYEYGDSIFSNGLESDWPL